MPFQPSTNVYIGTVPFDPSYRHVRYFSDREAQQQYFAALCPMSLRREDYTYQRVDDSIVVPFNAETLYGYNYCMFKNENYGERWFYSFITDVEYVNPNSSRLHLSLDIMQTWFPDCTVKACMVEREHVDDDSIGRNLRDEGINPGMLKQQSLDILDEGSWVTVVSCVVEPTSSGYVNNKGDLYGLLNSGSSRSVFANMSGHDALVDFQSFMQALSNNGQQDAVADAWMVPFWMVSWGGVFRLYDKDDGFGFWLKNRVDSTAAVREHSFTVPFDDCDGYVPKNNKLFTYPFSKLVATTSISQQEYVLEYFSSVKGLGRGSVATLNFSEVSAWEPDTSPFLYPMDYNGMGGEGQDLSISLPSWPTVTWVYQTFANMYSGGYGEKLSASIANSRNSFSTNLETNANSVMASIAQGAVGGAMSGALVGGGWGAALGAGVGAVSSAIGGVASSANALANSETAWENQYRNAKASLAQASLSPNTLKGTISSSAQSLNSGMYQTWFRVYRPRAEIARVIDDYFSMYGYSVGEIKVPNVVGRRSWNYVKTNGSSVVGKVPAGTLAQINRLFDRGITFWHVNDVGNYALDNSIV